MDFKTFSNLQQTVLILIFLQFEMAMTNVYYAGIPSKQVWLVIRFQTMERNGRDGFPTKKVCWRQHMI